MAEGAPDITTLHAIMARLRDRHDGCPWDVEQTFASIAPYTIEEAYEVADAITRNDMAALRDELGDLLLQVVFHSQMADEAGAFCLSDVIAAICDKMVRRHPHVFSNGAHADGWEGIKQEERQRAGAGGALDGVALALPALLRAQKLQKRAARVGFDWDDMADVEGKLAEELDELRLAPDDMNRFEEAGDLLFAAVNLLRHHGVDAEDALRAANAKFERRFRGMEALATEPFDTLNIDQQEELWQLVKEGERIADR